MAYTINNMSDYDYSESAADSTIVAAPVSDAIVNTEAPIMAEQDEVTQGYAIKDGDEVIQAQAMSGAMNYDILILAVLLVALIGGAVFFFLSQRNKGEQVPTSDPEEQAEPEEAAEEEEKIVSEEKVVDTQQM